MHTRRLLREGRPKPFGAEAGFILGSMSVDLRMQCMYATPAENPKCRHAVSAFRGTHVPGKDDYEPCKSCKYFEPEKRNDEDSRRYERSR